MYVFGYAFHSNGDYIYSTGWSLNLSLGFISQQYLPNWLCVNDLNMWKYFKILEGSKKIIIKMLFYVICWTRFCESPRISWEAVRDVGKIPGLTILWELQPSFRDPKFLWFTVISPCLYAKFWLITLQWRTGDVLQNYDTVFFIDESKIACGVNVGIFLDTYSVAVSYTLPGFAGVFQVQVLIRSFANLG